MADREKVEVLRLFNDNTPDLDNTLLLEAQADESDGEIFIRTHVEGISLSLADAVALRDFLIEKVKALDVISVSGP